MIPFTNPHGGIVIGAGGRTLKALMTRFGCYIQAHKAQHDQNRPLPYFLVQGPHEKAVNQATIEIYRLLNTSLMNGEKKHKAEIEELGNESTHAKLLVHERDEKISDLETEVEYLKEQLQDDDSKSSVGGVEGSWYDAGGDQGLIIWKPTGGSDFPKEVPADVDAVVPAEVRVVAKKEKRRPGPIMLAFDSDESEYETDDEETGITMNGK